MGHDECLLVSAFWQGMFPHDFLISPRACACVGVCVRVSALLPFFVVTLSEVVVVVVTAACCLPKNSVKLSTLFHLNESFTKKGSRAEGKEARVVPTGKPQLKSFVCHIVGCVRFGLVW